MHAPAVDARQTVLLAAIRAFAQGGYAGTSIQEILAATQLSKPTLYYYFGNKLGLFQSILDYAHDEAHARMKAAAAVGATCRDQLVEVAATLFEFVESHHDLTRLVFSSTFAAPRELPPTVINLKKRRRNFEFMLNIVKNGQRSGQLSDTHRAIELTHGIYGAISHRIRMRFLLLDKPLGRKAAERTVAIFLDGALKQ